MHLLCRKLCAQHCGGDACSPFPEPDTHGVWYKHLLEACRRLLEKLAFLGSGHPGKERSGLQEVGWEG